MKTWKRVYGFLKSTKLAVVLILYLAAASGLSTLVPQGKDPAFYRMIFPPGVARLVQSTGFDGFFKSAWFLLPIGAFSLCLLACTVDRLARGSRSGAGKRFGPDIIHVGVLVLMVGGLIRVYGRTERTVFLGEGEAARLPGGYTMVLDSFEFLKYRDGRPKDWYSRVTVSNGGEPVRTALIEVNRPLRIGRLKIYQSSHRQEASAELRDPSGRVVTVRPGDYYRRGDSIVVFRGVETVPGSGFTDEARRCPEEGFALFEELSGRGGGKGHAVLAVRRVAVSEGMDGFTVERLCAWNLAGLQIVEDRSVTAVIAALSLIGAGLSLTFIQKARESET